MIDRRYRSVAGLVSLAIVVAGCSITGSAPVAEPADGQASAPVDPAGAPPATSARVPTADPAAVPPVVVPPATDSAESADGPPVRVEERPLAAAGTSPDARAAAGTGRVESPVVTASDVFQTVGVTWAAGSAPDDFDLQIRTHDGSGWSEWDDVEPDDGTPDDGTPDAQHARRDGTSAVWVGAADAVQVAYQTSTSAPAPDDLHVVMLSTPTDDDATTPSTPGASGVGGAGGARPGTVVSLARAALSPDPPTLVTRAQWGAAPPACTPDVASQLVGVVVHHTADRMPTSQQDAMAMLRNDQRYHMQSRGWCDLGYNFVVDPWGNMYEGRVGSATAPVIGVHAGGFNTGTVGISVVGSYGTNALPFTAIDAIARIAAWRLAPYGRGATGSMTYTTPGGENSRYPAGTTVTLPVIFGHRDVAFTACPGNLGYQALATIRDLAQSYLDVIGGSHLGATLVRTSTDPTVFLATATAKYPIPRVERFIALSALGGVGYVAQSRLDGLATGPPIDPFVRSADGTISLVDRSGLHAVDSCAELAQWGASCASFGAMRVPPVVLAVLARGVDLTTSYRTAEGQWYVVDGGVRHEVADATALAGSAWQPNGPVITLDAAAGDALPYGDPIVRTGIAVLARDRSSAMLLDQPSGLATTASLLATTRLALSVPVLALDPASMRRLPAARAALPGVWRTADGRRLALTVGGATWLSDDQVPGVAGTTVAATVTSLLHPSDAGGPLFVRTPDVATVYLLDSGHRREVLSLRDLAALAGAGSPVVAVLQPGEMAGTPLGSVALGPGTLVKATSSPEVYLVDGLSRLVFLPSFALAAAAGVSTQWSPVPDDAVAGYTTADRSLGVLWRCGSEQLLADSGRLWNVPSGTLASGGAPALQLDALTCARLPRGGPWPGPVFVKAASAPTVYLLENGTRRAVPTMADALALAAGGRFTYDTVPDADLTALPEGPSVLGPGSLVKTADSVRIYVVDGLHRLVFLPSFDVSLRTGLGQAWRQVTAADLAGYTTDDEGVGTLWSCGSVVLAADGGTMLPVTTPGLLAAGGAPATVLDPRTCARPPRGAATARPVFVRTAADPSLYLLTGGTLRYAPTMDAAQAVAGPQPLLVMVVAPPRLAAVPQGAGLP